MSGNCIGTFFGKMAPVTAIKGAISLRLSAMDNALLHATGNYPTDKMEERINFSLSNARLYLDESYDERDNKSAYANTFDISCGDGGSDLVHPKKPPFALILYYLAKTIYLSSE